MRAVREVYVLAVRLTTGEYMLKFKIKFKAKNPWLCLYHTFCSEWQIFSNESKAKYTFGSSFSEAVEAKADGVY